MGEDIKLKDLYDEEQPYSEIGTLAVPKEDGSGNAYYVQRPIINYTLQDPPTHELTDADAGMFTWNAGDGTLIAPSGVANDGNVVGMVYAAKEGKTTKPIVRLAVSKNLTGIETGGNSVTLLYCWEEVTSANLKEIFYGANGSDLPEFTTQIGWGYLTQDAEGTVTGYAKIADTSTVTIGIQQPNTIKEGPFYALLAEESLEEKAVTITEKGAQTVVPTVGKSGMSKVNLQVDVAGGNLQEAKSQQFTAIYCSKDGDLGFYDPAVYHDSPGVFWVKPDDGYDGMQQVQITGKASMLGKDDASVRFNDGSNAVIELTPKDGYIGYPPGIEFDVDCVFTKVRSQETGESTRIITKNGKYDLMAYMQVYGNPGWTGPIGKMDAIEVNVETPPVPTLSVFQILETIGWKDGQEFSTIERKILPENCVFTSADWLNQELFDKTVGYWLVKNNCQWNPTGVVNDDGTVTVDLGDWQIGYGSETITGQVNEDGSVTIDWGQFFPLPVGLSGQVEALIQDDGTVQLPWIYYKTGTAQMLPIETTT